VKLHRIVGRAAKCGPSAMSAVTGLPTHDCAALLREVTGRKQIHGVQSYELMAAMTLAGWRCERTVHPRAARPTLAAWLDAHDTFAASFVLVVRRHFIAVGADEVADSGFMYSRRPQPVAGAPHRRARVRQTIAFRPETAP
jgi:hypothetical protein